MKTYKISNDTLACLIDIYCSGKNILWRMFFGWRETKLLSNGEQIRTFIISKKAYNFIENYYNEYFMEEK